MMKMYYENISVEQSQALAENGEIQPFYSINVSLAMTVNQITETFLKVAKEKNYITVENDKGQVLVIKRNNVKFKDLLLQCLFPQTLDKSISAIKLQIITNKLQCKRKISIKGLRGNVDENQKFLVDFENMLKLQRKGSFDQDEQELNQGDKTFNQSKQSEEDEIQNQDEDNEASSNPFTLESTANYMFQKILCAQAYGVGKKVSEFIKDFQNNYRNVEESAQLLPKPMEGIIALVNEIVDNLFSDYNYGKSETKSVMPYCKISVEKYVFGKLSQNLQSMYKFKYNNLDLAFEKKQKEIQEKMTIIQIFKFLESKPRYWLIQNEETFDEEFKNNKEIRPYNDAIRELEKIQYVSSPREKLKCTMMMRSMMRAGVIDFHKGREELASMDDELPILIYIILMCNINNLFTELQIVEDFINLDPSIEAEQRFLLNIRMAGKYISDEWVIQ
ncbi:vacuolar sorting protein 9, VPS9 domain protein (macronuclear) [Tetrahymena thermophila SB210]|uniref:Vacuolar sorting protein 9, VPS9 domain protein n=1 Tax=Tetrahymena thermophila (strain SB210) TaxID=312017 RepID=Q22NP9_TETTS|nr:vacuolar sorting protein 9, VPS9 domain protein [Tetrahymena thermophila SB210]EAR86736.2 vacuolar sorting protein 9, VPS9 domain protein [Tetrahymena thermophila SB210]|eukprot:XP_001006981.2 vacuolar sorting protein 9, VPS9 domain protein [Tetrahymena thermophila SB210]